jgi:hypothetical protein
MASDTDDIAACELFMLALVCFDVVAFDDLTYNLYLLFSYLHIVEA